MEDPIFTAKKDALKKLAHDFVNAIEELENRFSDFEFEKIDTFKPFGNQDTRAIRITAKFNELKHGIAIIIRKAL